MDEVDHVVLPFRGGRNGLVRDLVEHVVEVVDRIDDFADVFLLLRRDRRDLERVGGVAGSGIDSIDVVAAVERIAIRRVTVELQRIPLKEHDRDVDPAIPGGDDAGAEAVEVGLIEPVRSNLGLPSVAARGRCAAMEKGSSGRARRYRPAPSKRGPTPSRERSCDCERPENPGTRRSRTEREDRQLPGPSRNSPRCGIRSGRSPCRSRR